MRFKPTNCENFKFEYFLEAEKINDKPNHKALTTIPALTSALFFIISPESPMWLAENEHYDELISTLDMFYPGNHWKGTDFDFFRFFKKCENF